jgi:hypothetical protein
MERKRGETLASQSRTNMGYGGLNNGGGLSKKERRDLGKAKAHDA